MKLNLKPHVTNNNASLGKRMTWQEITDLFAERVGQEKNRRFKLWMLDQGKICGGHPFFNAETYYFCYRVALKIQCHDNDHCTCVVGVEGSGKSTLAFQLAATISDTFCMDNILYEPSDFFNQIEQAAKGDSIIIDEGILFLFGREASTSVNKDIMKLFTLIRQKNLHIIICIPQFKSLDTQLRQDRVDNLFNIYEKGLYEAHEKESIMIINDVYPKSKSILKAVKTPLNYFCDGRFNKPFPVINDISEKKYKELKSQNLTDVIKRLRGRFEASTRKSSLTPTKEGKKDE